MASVSQVYSRTNEVSEVCLERTWLHLRNRHGAVRRLGKEERVVDDADFKQGECSVWPLKGQYQRSNRREGRKNRNVIRVVHDGGRGG